MIFYKALNADGKAAARAAGDAAEAVGDTAEAAKAAAEAAKAAGWSAEDAERRWQAARLAELLGIDPPRGAQQIGGVS